jgi:hypothetical protein
MLAPMISRHFPFPAPSPAPLRETPHHCARPLTPDDVKIVKNASKIIEDLKIVISEASSTRPGLPMHGTDVKAGPAQGILPRAKIGSPLTSAVRPWMGSGWKGLETCTF